MKTRFASNLAALSLAASLLGGCAWVAGQPPAPPLPAAPTLVPARAEPPSETTAPARPEDPEGGRKWTFGAVRGRVVDVKKDGSAVIRVFMGRKAVDFTVPPDSPKAAELAKLVGKDVEAEGRMEFIRGGERSLYVTELAEVEGG